MTKLILCANNMYLRAQASEPSKNQQIFNRIRLSHAIEFFSLSIEKVCVSVRFFIFFLHYLVFVCYFLRCCSGCCVHWSYGLSEIPHFKRTHSVGLHFVRNIVSLRMNFNRAKIQIQRTISFNFGICSKKSKCFVNILSVVQVQ